MLRKLYALVFLVLAVSPFTAPFQTFYEANRAVVAPLTDADDPGSLVAPLITKADRLTIALPMGLVISPFTPVVFLTPFIAAPHLASRDAVRQTVLRV